MARPTAIRRILIPLLAACLLLANCAPSLQPMGPRAVEPSLTETAYVAADGVELPLRHWLPSGKEPKAVILALHGFNDYAQAFDMPGAWWALHGVATYAYDQRGFGQAGRRGIWPGTETLVADLLNATRAVQARHPGVPLYLLGESMGGAVILTALAGRGLPAGVKGAILSAPAVWSRDTMPFYQRAALAAASWTVPWLAMKPPKGIKIQASDNIEMLRALGRDPLVIKRTRVDAVRGLTDLMDRAMHSARMFNVPALVMYGDHEQLIPREPVDIALSSLPAGGPRVAVYADGWHLLLRDLQAEIVWRDVLAWIDAPDAPLPSGADRHPRTRPLQATLPRASQPTDAAAR